MEIIDKLQKISDTVWELPATYKEGMRAPARITRHHQRAAVKAVTLHGFSVEKHDGGWKVKVLLDI